MKHLFTLTLLLTSILLTAQESQEETSEKKFSISGSVDAYFRTNLTGPNEAFEDGDDTFFLNPGTSFADRSGFSLGMANAIISYDGDKVGFVADLVFGPRGEDAVFLSAGSSNIVNQLYMYYNVSESVTLTLGNFNTFLGYEVISPTGNFNYSTSYMFSNGPFSHTGLKADIALSDDFSLMLAVMNSTDFTEINLDGSYTGGLQLGYKDQYLNFVYGDQTGSSGSTFQVDYTGGSNLSDDFFLGINATYNDTDGSGFYGAALYPQYTVSETFALGLRGEYFGVHAEDFDDETVFAATLSANYSIDDLTIIPEIRLDSWSEEFYFDNDLEPSKSLASFLVAAVYKFN
ncbi:outer membrane beta-barrel protein [Psychroserpens algicola]|uniref:Porin n=1 Tax=Psychroserpens algicola TaxID=1719034 RepID=A0ABT0H7Y7_9FLAO|nr:outer membrane beta-barrel protein [Psychroserpens algicola]MCK8480473.1 porin [Psychroserpens algicola]